MIHILKKIIRKRKHMYSKYRTVLIEKNPRINGPAPFRPVPFKGQQCLRGGMY